MQSLPDQDRRTLADRRQVPTSVWNTLRGIGQRMRLRRLDEHGRAYFVDRFATSTLILIVVLLLLSIVDALITIRLLAAGCDEFNPLMAWLLGFGVLPFLLGKYVLTAAGLPILVIFKNFTLFGSRLRVYHLIPAFVALYVALILYQLTLLHTHAGI